MDQDESEKTFGVYNVVGVRGESRASIKPIGLIQLKQNESIQDELLSSHIIVEEPDNLDKVVGEVYKCNIINNYLMMTKTQPVMYVSVFLDKKVKKIELFKLFMNFTISEETKIEKSDDLINNELDGQFSLEVSIENTRKKLNKIIPRFPGNNKMAINLINFIKSAEMIEFIKELVTAENEKILKELKDKYGNMYTSADFKIPRATISLKDYL